MPEHEASISHLDFDVVTPCVVTSIDGSYCVAPAAYRIKCKACGTIRTFCASHTGRFQMFGMQWPGPMMCKPCGAIGPFWEMVEIHKLEAES